MSITLLYKPLSNACNIRCTYCYYNDFPKSGKLPVQQAVTAIKKLNEVRPKEDINFIWHGGEPLLVGRDYFEKVIASQAQIHGVSIRNSVQTNGTLIDEAWIELFKKYNIHVGVSLDGPATVHDATRKRRSGAGTHADVMAAIKLLQANDVSFGALCTVTSASLGCEEIIFGHFDKNDVWRYNIKPCLDGATSYTDSISPHQWARFVITYFDHWITKDDPRIKIKYFEDLVRRALGGHATTCFMNKGCRNIFSIDHAGALYVCDDTNPMVNAISQLDPSKMSHDEIRGNFEKEAGCDDCSFYYLCQGYCPRHYSLGTKLCDALRSIYRHVVNRVHEYRESINIETCREHRIVH